MKFKLIATHQGQMGGVPCIRGLRIHRVPVNMDIPPTAKESGIKPTTFAEKHNEPVPHPITEEVVEI